MSTLSHTRLAGEGSHQSSSAEMSDLADIEQYFDNHKANRRLIAHAPLDVVLDVLIETFPNHEVFREGRPNQFGPDSRRSAYKNLFDWHNKIRSLRSVIPDQQNSSTGIQLTSSEAPPATGIPSKIESSAVRKSHEDFGLCGWLWTKLRDLGRLSCGEYSPESEWLGQWYAHLAVSFTPGGPMIDMCVDSGSCTSFIDRGLAAQSQCKVDHVETGIQFGGMGGGKIPIRSKATVTTLMSATSALTCEMYVMCKLDFGLLLGIDVMFAERMVIDFETLQLHHKGRHATYPIQITRPQHVSWQDGLKGLKCKTEGSR